jgi:hypothetical protein
MRKPPDIPKSATGLASPTGGKAKRQQPCVRFSHRSRRVQFLARVAKDHRASLRVLEQCGFTVIGDDRRFASVREQEIEELQLQLS